MATAYLKRRTARLSATLIKREFEREPVTATPPPIPKRSELAANARTFTMTWAGGFVFFLTFIG